MLGVALPMCCQRSPSIAFAACDSAQWLAHKGTVGKVLFGELHVLDAQMKPCPTRNARDAVVQDRNAVRIFQRSGQDGGRAVACGEEGGRALGFISFILPRGGSMAAGSGDRSLPCFRPGNKFGTLRCPGFTLSSRNFRPHVEAVHDGAG